MTKNKHHYIPQFYTKGFLNKENKVFVLNKKINEIHDQGKHGTFHIHRHNSFDWGKLQKQNLERAKELCALHEIPYTTDESLIDKSIDGIENLFSFSESKAAEIFEKIKNKENLSYEDRSNLSAFVALMKVRVPSTRNRTTNLVKKLEKDNIKKMLSDKEFLKNVAKLESDKAGKSYNQILKEYGEIKESDFDIEIPQELEIQNMMIQSIYLMRLFENSFMHFFFIEDVKKNLITNDDPVVNVGKGIYIFPINKKILLLLDSNKKPSIGYSIFDNIFLKKNNKILFDSAKKYVISTSKKYLESYLI